MVPLGFGTQNREGETLPGGGASQIREGASLPRRGGEKPARGWADFYLVVAENRRAMALHGLTWRA